MILGKTGFIGQNLYNKMFNDGQEVIGCSRSTGVDMLVYEEIRDFIKDHQPGIIYNVASHGGSMRYVRDYAPMFCPTIFKNEFKPLQGSS